VTYLVASLACEYGWDPELIMEWSPEMLDTVIEVHEDRVREMNRRQ
jgi:hypothetical protein